MSPVQPPSGGDGCFRASEPIVEMFLDGMTFRLEIEVIPNGTTLAKTVVLRSKQVRLWQIYRIVCWIHRLQLKGGDPLEEFLNNRNKIVKISD
jgi:hypothetical protein